MLVFYHSHLKTAYSSRFYDLLFLVVLIALMTGGCSTPFRHPVPRELVKEVSPLNLQEIRQFVEPSNPLGYQPFFDNSLSDILNKHTQSGTVVNMLALSGGADGGAFGAGVLNGWTLTGSRPEFDIVTGISTGALMAPFAFLGPGSDQPLEDVYTTITRKSIFTIRSIGEILSARDAISDSMPLSQLIQKYIDKKTLVRIAREHTKGRRLFVGTTHLDSGQLVVWDMGAIAVSTDPAAPKLFRDVLIASASIPIAFPPVYLALEADGKNYDEMHVDGGLINQVFGVEVMANSIAKKKSAGETIKARVFMIRNSELNVRWQPVSKKLINIADRTVSVMINSQSMGDIFRNFTIAHLAGIDFYVVGIPLDFEAEHPELFDQEYMIKLFAKGYEMGQKKSSWKSHPFGFRPISTGVQLETK